MAYPISLSGVKRTCGFALHMSAFDPKRTSDHPLTEPPLNRYDPFELKLAKLCRIPYGGAVLNVTPEMTRLCDACKAQITKGPDDPGHPGLKFVFKGPGREKQYLCINCGETIFHNPDITPAWRAD